MTNPIRILFVEDVPADMELGAVELQKADIACVTMRVDKEKELSHALQTFHPELVICDYSMPRFNGMEAVRLIQGHDPNLPVIMFTATQNEMVAVECMKAGAVDYILKDNITRLPFAIKEALGKKHLRKTREKAMNESQAYIAELKKLNEELKTARQASLNLLEDLSAEMEINESTRKDLAKSEQKYRKLFEFMAQGVFYQDATGTMADVNESALRLFGLTRDEFLGRTSASPEWKVIREDGTVVTGADHPSMIALKTATSVTNTTLGVYNPTNDTYTWMIVNAVPEFHPGENKPFRVAVTLHDITQLRQTQKLLKESIDRFRQVTESAGAWIWEVDSQGLYTYSNSVVEEILGYTTEEVTGIKHFYDLFVPEQKESLRSAAFEAFKTRQTFRNFENRNVCRDGRIVILETNGSPITDRQGNLLGYRGADRDITERKEAEEALIQKNDELQRFNDLTIDREFDMITLKKEINELLKRLGENAKYKIVE